MRVDGKIYADYQATTPTDPIVLKAMLPYFMNDFGNPHSNEHSWGWQAEDAVNKSTKLITNLIGADCDEIVYTSGATESNNLDILGSLRKSPKRKKILVSSIEHKSILAIGREFPHKNNIEFISVPVTSQGAIDLQFIEDQLDENTLMVSIGAVNNEIGTIQPISDIGAMTTKYGAYFHCDAAQAPCTMDIDVFESNIDFLSLSAHKIYGPKGIGALYIKRGLASNIEPLLFGGGQQNGLRSGTLPVPLCVGFGKAAELLQNNLKQSERLKVQLIRNHFIQDLINYGVRFKLNGPTENSKRHAGNCNIIVNDIDAHDLIATLQPNVAISSGSACTSGSPEPSYVLTAIGLSKEEAASSIRVSFGRFSTYEDAQDIAKLISDNIRLLS